MSTHYRLDAARVASRRPLPKPRKMLGPVGEKRLPADVGLYLGIKGVAEHNSCNDCGHHICSCEQQTAPLPTRTGPVGCDHTWLLICGLVNCSHCGWVSGIVA
jgi:hypothetical protein